MAFAFLLIEYSKHSLFGSLIKMKLFRMSALLMVLTSLFVSMQASADQIAWAKNYDDALSAAKSANKLIMVDFYTDWCGWCKKLDADVYPNPKVIQAVSQVIPVKVNAEKEGVELAKKYAVSGYPTILFLNTDGAVEGVIGGYVPADGFVAMTNKFVANHKELPGLIDHVTKNPTDTPSVKRLVDIYCNSAQPDKAAALLDKMGDKGTSAKKEQIDGNLAIANAFLQKRNVESAEQRLRKVLEYKPTGENLASAHTGLGICDLLKNQADACISEITPYINDKSVSDPLKKRMQQLLDYAQNMKKTAKP
jgi:thioredoxin-related protein